VLAFFFQVPFFFSPSAVGYVYVYLLQYANIFLCNPDGWSGIQCFLGQFEPDYEDGNGNGILFAWGNFFDER